MNAFLADKSIPVFPQPPIRRISVTLTSFYSSGLNNLKGRHFGTLNNIQKSVTDELRGIPALL
jgi:hypothetical protein